MNIVKTIAVAGVALLISAPAAFAQNSHPMGFFVTSTGMGDGANLGGLAGADAHCGKLAAAAGSTGRTWRAYLSTQVEGKRGISAATASAPAPGTTPMANLSPAISISCTSCPTSPNGPPSTKTASR